MLANPLADPLFAPTATVLAAVLGAGLLLLLVVTRGSLTRLRGSVLFQRWLVWAAIAPLYSLAVLSGPLPMLVLVSLMVWQGLREYGRMVGLPPLYRNVLLTLGLGLGPLALWSPSWFFQVLPLLLIVGTLQPLLTQDVRAGATRLALAVLGFGYLPLLLDHLLLIHAGLPGGPGLLLTIGLAVALSDVGAFCVGKLFGRRHFAPLLSPNKTLEGLVGNLIGASAGVLLLGFALPVDLSLAGRAALPVVVALGAIWGDLVESLLKREFGVKDSGAWLPGFGGLLDRIDSLVVVAPLTYTVARVLG